MRKSERHEICELIKLVKLAVCFVNQTAIQVPVETGTGISLAAGRYMFMTGNVTKSMPGTQGLGQSHQGVVLGIFERLEVSAFQLDSNREIITPFTLSKA